MENKKMMAVSVFMTVFLSVLINGNKAQIISA